MSYVVYCRTFLYYEKGGVPPWIFNKVINPKDFDLEQIIYDHRHVGQAGKNGKAPKWQRGLPQFQTSVF